MANERIGKRWKSFGVVAWGRACRNGEDVSDGHEISAGPRRVSVTALRSEDVRVRIFLYAVAPEPRRCPPT
jgi:hypothetical protein